MHGPGLNKTVLLDGTMAKCCTGIVIRMKWMKCLGLGFHSGRGRLGLIYLFIYLFK